MNKEIHTLVIPDVHGRIFWKEAINKFPKEQYPNLTIVFLGDYLDPYDFEGVTKKKAIENFKEIIELAKQDNRIHLLIGNHDMHYWYDARYKVRVDERNYNKIKDLFLQNFTMFNIAYEEIINNTKYLYTHAGVTSFWLNHIKFMGERGIEMNKVEYIDRLGQKKKKVSNEQLPFCQMLANMTPTVDELNQMKLNFQGQALLWAASFFRGGDDDCGSCIWADYDEWAYENSGIESENPELKGMWQIFGHSLAAGGFDEGIINNEKHIAMLDARQAWVINNDGEIIKLKEYATK